MKLFSFFIIFFFRGRSFFPLKPPNPASNPCPPQTPPSPPPKNTKICSFLKPARASKEIWICERTGLSLTYNVCTYSNIIWLERVIYSNEWIWKKKRKRKRKRKRKGKWRSERLKAEKTSSASPPPPLSLCFVNYPSPPNPIPCLRNKVNFYFPIFSFAHFKRRRLRQYVFSWVCRPLFRRIWLRSLSKTRFPRWDSQVKVRAGRGRD